MHRRPETPLLTVDIVIEIDSANQIVLIERKNPPFGWALPGGFVDRGETVEQAAVREAKEETSLTVELLFLLGCYSDPTRDIRMHTASIVYVAKGFGTPIAADDAKTIKLCDTNNFPEQLAFDHAVILKDYLHYNESGQAPPLACVSYSGE